MAEQLHAQRCHIHLDREAAARCPECVSFYCRECVTEHEERVICTACLRKKTSPTETRPWPLRGAFRSLLALLGTAWCWLTFVWIGRLLLAIPARFHEGTVWKLGIWDK